jgi:hypothetical protein
MRTPRWPLLPARVAPGAGDDDRESRMATNATNDHQRGPATKRPSATSVGPPAARGERARDRLAQLRQVGDRSLGEPMRWIAHGADDDDERDTIPTMGGPSSRTRPRQRRPDAPACRPCMSLRVRGGASLCLPGFSGASGYRPPMKLPRSAPRPPQHRVLIGVASARPAGRGAAHAQRRHPAHGLGEGGRPSPTLEPEARRPLPRPRPATGLWEGASQHPTPRPP